VLQQLAGGLVDDDLGAAQPVAELEQEVPGAAAESSVVGSARRSASTVGDHDRQLRHHNRDGDERRLQSRRKNAQLLPSGSGGVELWRAALDQISF